LNILTGKGEIGSSTLRAAGGKYFSKAEPNPGYCSGISNVGCYPNTPIRGLWGGLEMIAL